MKVVDKHPDHEKNIESQEGGCFRSSVGMGFRTSFVSGRGSGSRTARRRCRRSSTLTGGTPSSISRTTRRFGATNTEYAQSPAIRLVRGCERFIPVFAHPFCQALTRSCLKRLVLVYFGWLDGYWTQNPMSIQPLSNPRPRSVQK